ncbi:hypothetical protein EJB05_53965, partial [Eragrostis curvula]
MSELDDVASVASCEPAGDDDYLDYLVSESPVDDMTNVPKGHIDEIDGKLDSSRQCRHLEPSVRKVCSEGKDTGRHFYGCARKEKPCNYYAWIDPKWPNAVEEILETMTTRVRDYELEAKLAIAQVEAMIRDKEASTRPVSCKLQAAITVMVGAFFAMVSAAIVHVINRRASSNSDC